MLFYCLEIELNSRLLYINMAYSECKVCSKCYLGVIDYSGLVTVIITTSNLLVAFPFMFSLLPVLTLCG